jgi:hypothetical protein
MLRSRREVLGAFVSAAAALALLGPGRAAASGRAAQRGRPESALGIEAGAMFGTCRVTRVGKVELGTVSVRLEDQAGRPFTVDLLRHDPATPGIARAGSLDAFVSNDGDGVLATNEEHGLAAMAIAKHLSAREAAGVSLPSLLTLRERAERRRRPRARAY